jgi:hypothetical protein
LGWSGSEEERRGEGDNARDEGKKKERKRRAHMLNRGQHSSLS